MIDCLFPGTFPFSKVKWQAKHDYEFVENYRILTAAMAKNGIKKIIDVKKLAECKYQDNLEFCQWLKAYYESRNPGEEYDALARRKGQDLHLIGAGNRLPKPVAKPMAQPERPQTAMPRMKLKADLPSFNLKSRDVNASDLQAPMTDRNSKQKSTTGNAELQAQITELQQENEFQRE